MGRKKKCAFCGDVGILEVVCPRCYGDGESGLAECRTSDYAPCRECRSEAYQEWKKEYGYGEEPKYLVSSNQLRAIKRLLRGIRNMSEYHKGTMVSPGLIINLLEEIIRNGAVRLEVWRAGGFHHKTTTAVLRERTK